jgi:hypothetical protein
LDQFSTGGLDQFSTGGITTSFGIQMPEFLRFSLAIGDARAVMRR